MKVIFLEYSRYIPAAYYWAVVADELRDALSVGTT